MKTIFKNIPFYLGFIINIIVWITINFIDKSSKQDDLCFDCSQEFGKPFSLYKSDSFCCSAYIMWEGLISDIIIILLTGVLLGTIFNFLRNTVFERNSNLKGEIKKEASKNILFKWFHSKNFGTTFRLVFAINTFFWIVVIIIDGSSQLKKICSDCYRGFGKPFRIYEPDSIIGSAHIVWEGIIANITVIILTSFFLAYLFKIIWSKFNNKASN